MKILIIKPSSLGDIIHAVPVVRYLKKLKGKELEIHWIVNENFADIVKASGAADRVIPFDRSAWGKKMNMLYNLRGFFRSVRELRREHYDMAVDFQCLFRSSLLAFLSGAPRRAGYDRTREGARFFLNELAPVKGKDMHAVEENFAVIRNSFRLEGDLRKSELVFEMQTSEETKRHVSALLEKKGIDGKKLVLVNPNSRWDSKKWGMENYKKLVQKLAEAGFSVAVIGSEDEKAAGDALEKINPRKIRNLSGGTDLPQLYELMKRASCLVTNDSGPMHLSSAAGTSTVAVFGPTSAKRTGPYWKSRVLEAHVPCSPCFRKKCPLRGSENMRCMRSVSVETVFQAVQDEMLVNK